MLLKPADATGHNIEALRRHGIPFVLVDRVAEGRGECSVSVDDVTGGALAVRHLVDAGHRDIESAAASEHEHEHQCVVLQPELVVRRSALAPRTG